MAHLHYLTKALRFSAYIAYIAYILQNKEYNDKKELMVANFYMV